MSTVPMSSFRPWEVLGRVSRASANLPRAAATALPFRIGPDHTA